MQPGDSIFVAGHNGMVGRAITRRLQRDGFTRVTTADKSALDLLNQADVSSFIQPGRFDHVIIAAARVGGIQFNINHPATIGYQNGQIALNLLEACHRADVERVMFLGSSCIYPRECRQPMREEDLLTGPLEPTNELYALAKVFGMRLVDAYQKEFGRNWISCQPCNLYGPYDNFSPENSHFIAAMIRRFYHARLSGQRTIECWGTGNARREVLHVDDVADAILLLADRYKGSFLNVGAGEDHSIREYAELIADVTGYDGRIEWDTEKPEGMPQKLLDSSGIQELGWSSQTSLKTGIQQTFHWWLENGAEDEIPTGRRLVG